METKDLTALRILSDAMLPPLNVAVVGSAGVGKSSLINAFFGVDVAVVGVGQPITTQISRYPLPGTNVSIYDTRGLEVEKSEETTRQLEELIVTSRRSADLDDQIHIAWLCVSALSRRFEPIHQTLAQMFAATRVPYVIVITKSFGQEADELEQHIRSIGWITAPVLQVVAAPKYSGGELIVDAFGLDCLAAVTAERVGPARAAAADHQRYDASRRDIAFEALQDILQRKTVLESLGTLAAMNGYGIPAMVAANRLIAERIARNVRLCAQNLGVGLSNEVEQYVVEMSAKTMREAALAKSKAAIDTAKSTLQEALKGDFSTVGEQVKKSFKMGFRQLNPLNTAKDLVGMYRGEAPPEGGHLAAQYIRDITLVALSPVVEARVSGQPVIGKSASYRRSLTAMLRWAGVSEVIAPELVPLLRATIAAEA